MAQVQVQDDGDVLVMTMTRAESIALAAALEAQRLPDTIQMQAALVGSPPWQRGAGEGTDGPISRGELTEYQLAHGLTPQTI